MAFRVAYTKKRPLVRVPVGQSATVYSVSRGFTLMSTNVDNVQLIANDRTGETLADYRQKVANMEDATTEFHDSQYALEFTPLAEWMLYDVWETQLQSGSYALSAAISPVSFTECAGALSHANDIALAKMYNRLYHSFQGLTFLGELKESIRMLRNPAMGFRKGLDRYLRDARRVRHSVARNSRIPVSKRRAAYAADVGELWLEWAFGVKPLANDIQNAYDVVMDMMVDRFAENFSHRASEISWKNYYHEDGWNYDKFITSGRIGVKATVQYKGAAYVDIESSLNTQYQLGLLPEQFIPTAWELAPYSWLIDYVTNIGDVLNAWASAQRLKFVYLAKTTRQVTVKKTTTVCTPTSGYYVAHLTKDKSRPGTGYVYAKKVDRVRVLDKPLPSFHADFKLNWGRGLNILALVAAKNRDASYTPFRR